MGRDKLKRNLSFKPICKGFKTTECINEHKIHLLHEELEALYLMDIKELYQADAAKKMGISRPTFAKILKDARSKVAMVLVTGSTLIIEDEKDDYLILLPSDYNDKLKVSNINAKYLHIYEVRSKKVKRIKVIKNPVFEQNIRPAQIIPQICNQEGINFFLAKQIGAGLEKSLLSIGIHSFIKDKIDINSLKNLV